MYKLVVVGRAKGGMVREAIGAMKAFAEYGQSKFNLKTDVFVQLFGPSGTIYLIGEHPDLATLQATQAKIMADEGYWTLVKKATEVIDPPTMSLLQKV